MISSDDFYVNDREQACLEVSGGITKVQFNISAKQGTESLGERLAPVFALTNRPDGMGYAKLKIGIAGRKGSGKTPLSDSFLNAYGDLDVAIKDKSFFQLMAKSPSFGEILRIDAHYEGFCEDAFGSKYSVLRDQMRDKGLVIVEHAWNVDEEFHMAVIFDNALYGDSRKIYIYCEEGLAKPLEYQTFLNAPDTPHLKRA